MEPVYSMRPVLAILVSLVCAVLILASGERRRNLREFWTLLAAFSKFVIVISMLPLVMNGGVYEFTVMSILPGIPLHFRVDALGILFATLASMLWIMTSVYSIGYMRKLREHAQTRYFFCFAVCLSSAIGIAFAANLLTLFIFYEVMTIATYPLVIHKETPEALRAGRKYLIYLLTGGILILLGMVITYSLTGTLSFADNGILAGNGSTQVLRALFAIFIVGFGMKAALMPLHGWLPSAMIAPTPVSSLLHAVAVVKAGVFGIMRIVCHVYGIELMADIGVALPLAIVASFTIIMASIFALAQDNLKRRLAYSTISQLSYIILGAALLSPSGLTGGILHIANHGFMKITLFFCAGAIFVVTGKKNISEMNGLGRRMPVTMTMFFIAALGMCGFPPVSGFISKWYLCMGALEAGGLFFFFMLLVSSLMNVAYFFPI
ncbi:monovalent cation/H+ antiporter subunit D family protein, partial [Halobacteriota archaeon]